MSAKTVALRGNSMAAILRDAGMPSNAHRVDETFHRGKRRDTARCTERSAILSFRLLRVPAGVPERVVSCRETLRSR
jgi:hypothetical protein